MSIYLFLRADRSYTCPPIPPTIVEAWKDLTNRIPIYLWQHMTKKGLEWRSYHMTNKSGIPGLTFSRIPISFRCVQIYPFPRRGFLPGRLRSLPLPRSLARGWKTRANIPSVASGNIGGATGIPRAWTRTTLIMLIVVAVVGNPTRTRPIQRTGMVWSGIWKKAESK